jgi:hypothetical protein
MIVAGLNVDLMAPVARLYFGQYCDTPEHTADVERWVEAIRSTAEILRSRGESDDQVRGAILNAAIQAMADDDRADPEREATLAATIAILDRLLYRPTLRLAGCGPLGASA